MKTIMIGMMALIFMTSVVSAYSSWNDVINDYTYLTYKTKSTWTEAKSMSDVINRIFYMKLMLSKPVYVSRGGSSNQEEAPIIPSLQGDYNKDGIVDIQDFLILFGFSSTLLVKACIKSLLNNFR